MGITPFQIYAVLRTYQQLLETERRAAPKKTEQRPPSVVGEDRVSLSSEAQRRRTGARVASPRAVPHAVSQMEREESRSHGSGV